MKDEKKPYVGCMGEEEDDVPRKIKSFFFFFLTFKSKTKLISKIMIKKY